MEVLSAPIVMCGGHIVLCIRLSNRVSCSSGHTQKRLLLYPIPYHQFSLSERNGCADQCFIPYGAVNENIWLHPVVWYPHKVVPLNHNVITLAGMKYHSLFTFYGKVILYDIWGKFVILC